MTKKAKRKTSERYNLLQQRDGYGWSRVCFKGTGIGAWYAAERVSAGESIASVVKSYDFGDGSPFTRAAVNQALLLMKEARRQRQSDITVYWRSRPNVAADRPRSEYAN